MGTVAVVIPALNEAATIQNVIETIPRDCVAQIIVVDDASRDATSRIAKETGAVVVRHGRNLGIGAAIRNGYRRALAMGAEILVVVAADGQHDPKEIPNLIRPILDDEADYVVGDRLSGNPVREGMPRHRYYGNKLLTWITGKITGLDVKDSQCGFTAISRTGILNVNLGFLSNRWGVPNDMLLECAMRGLRVKYVPIRPIYGGRKSYIKLAGFGIRLLAILARGTMRYLYYYRGTIVFTTAGGLLILVGIAYGAIIVAQTLATGHLPGTGSVILDATIILTGIQVLVFGLLAEMLKMIESKTSEYKTAS